MNINQIADMAEVSRATVSRYLNDGYVSEEKRGRIAKVIEETGYVPSTQAQTLRTGKTKIVGVIIPKISSEAIGREVAGISQTLGDSGYQLLLANTDNDEKAEVRYLRVLSDDQVDGIILTGTIVTPRHREAMSSLHVPLVILGQQVEGRSCVYFDDYNGMLELCRLVAKGARHPAYLGVTEADKAAGQMRRAAFDDAMAEAGIRVPEDARRHGEFSISSGHDMAKDVLRELPHTDALVCATDNIAAGTMAYLHETGRRIPEDVQVTGVGDSQVARVVTPSLTTVHFYYRTSGSEAAKLLIDMMGDGPTAPREVRMGHRLVVGGSTLC